MRRLGFLLTGLAILVGINVTVWRFEHAMSSGETVLLELAPVDPRSLMQGDYMRLSYALARQDGEAGQQETKASHEGISLPRMFNSWRAPSSRAPEPSSSQDLVIRVSPRS